MARVKQSVIWKQKTCVNCKIDKTTNDGYAHLSLELLALESYSGTRISAVLLWVSKIKGHLEDTLCLCIKYGPLFQQMILVSLKHIYLWDF